MRQARRSTRKAAHPARGKRFDCEDRTSGPPHYGMRIWLEARLGAPAILIGKPVSDRQIRKCPRGGDKRTSSTRMVRLAPPNCAGSRWTWDEAGHPLRGLLLYQTELQRRNADRTRTGDIQINDNPTSSAHLEPAQPATKKAIRTCYACRCPRRDRLADGNQQTPARMANLGVGPVQFASARVRSET